MQPNERLALCVSIHDVAPATWPECLHLLHAIRAVADIPLSWLVVPCYHGDPRVSRPYERALEQLAGRGHELVLHGYTHLDDGPPAQSLGQRLLRTRYTQGEGEFAALDQDAARRRIELGLQWFHQRSWPVAGFIPPAWLMSDATLEAVRQCGLEYTATYGRFYSLRTRRMLLAPSMVYAARNQCGRWLSPAAAIAIAHFNHAAPLARLALHPRDARHPALVRHAQRLIEQLLARREAVTKYTVARRLASQAGDGVRDDIAGGSAGKDEHRGRS